MWKPDNAKVLEWPVYRLQDEVGNNDLLWVTLSERKRININRFAGLSWDGAKEIVYVFFVGGSFLMAEKTYKQNPPQIPGQSRDIVMYVLVCFFRSHIQETTKRPGNRGFKLSGPISRDTAILWLRYPISHDAFSGRLALPQNGAIPPLGT